MKTDLGKRCGIVGQCLREGIWVVVFFSSILFSFGCGGRKEHSVLGPRLL